MHLVSSESKSFYISNCSYRHIRHERPLSLANRTYAKWAANGNYGSAPAFKWSLIWDQSLGPLSLSVRIVVGHNETFAIL